MNSNKEEFNNFKTNLIEKSEKKYGAQLRIKYGTSAVEKSNQLLMNMTEHQYDKFIDLRDEISQNLKLLSKEPESKTLPKKIVKEHQRWLKIAWGKEVTPKEHKEVADMYLTDKRFADFYNKSAKTKFATELLHQAIYNFYEK